MIALMNTDGLAVQLEPDFIESIEQSLDCLDSPCQTKCVVRMASGKTHEIARSYAYVTGIVRSHNEAAVQR